MSRLDDIMEKLDRAQLPDVDFDKYFQEAESEDIRKVKKVGQFFDEINDFLENDEVISGTPMPFQRIRDKLRFRDGEVTMWSGFNGHKKSMVLGFVSLSFLRAGQKVCTASFEMKPIRTIERMVKQHTRVSAPTGVEYADFLQFADRNFYIFDHLGGITPQRLYGIIMYTAQELGVKHFIIDSLMRVIPGEDNYNLQKDFVVKLCDIAQRTNCHIHLVHHANKGKESEVGSRYNAKGSGAISDNIHNSIVVWSNKDKLDGMPDVILRCDKQREGEWEGKIALNFNPDCLTFEEAF